VGTVLIIGFIDADVKMIDAAREYGFKVYYGDGTRLDILHAAGAGTARAVGARFASRAVLLTMIDLAGRRAPHARSFGK
jgi:glutathione-regulated potassium-efflux system protein KefB